MMKFPHRYHARTPIEDRKRENARDPLKYAHLRLFYYETVSAFGASHNVSLPALAFLSGDRKCRAIGSIVG